MKGWMKNLISRKEEQQRGKEERQLSVWEEVLEREMKVILRKNIQLN